MGVERVWVVTIGRVEDLLEEFSLTHRISFLTYSFVIRVADLEVHVYLSPWINAEISVTLLEASSLFGGGISTRFLVVLVFQINEKKHCPP